MDSYFYIYQAFTVANDYTWDLGVPYKSTDLGFLAPNGGATIPTLPVNTATIYASFVKGYAPGTQVMVAVSTTPTSNFDLTAINTEYIWDFGDYYNQQNNYFTASCWGMAEHTYIMPGTYDITLTVKETFQQFIPDPAQINALKLITRTITDSYTRRGCVVVEEIPPVAKFHTTNITGPTGKSPYEVYFSARTTIPGSFPIDRIVWDFGDGSPLLTISRYTTAQHSSDSSLFNAETFNADLADPRNYEPGHTYVRTSDTYPVFYPSLTAYSSSTDTSDSCSITVGPIDSPTIQDANENIKFLKNKSTPYGSFYVLSLDNNIGFMSTTSSQSAVKLIPTKPTNPIRCSLFSPDAISNGNKGSNYYTSDNLTC